LNSNYKIDLNSRVVKNEEIISTDMDEETVMMSVELGEYYGVNPVGSRIWKLLDKPVLVSEICRTLQAEYDVQPGQCQTEVMEFVSKLLEKKLIVIK